MSTRRPRKIRSYWRFILIAGLVMVICSLVEITLGIIDRNWFQGGIGAALLLIYGGFSAARWRQYRQLSPEQLNQTIPENRRTTFRFRWPEEEARLKKED